MAISASLVKQLRDKTGLGMMVCKNALEETGGDMDKAFEYLRKKGEATAEKRRSKEANQGKVSVRIGTDTAVLYEVNCETDFVARNDDFQSFAEALGELLLTHTPADAQQAKNITAPAFNGKTVEEWMKELIGKIGEKIDFSQFRLRSFSPDTQKVFSYIHGNGKIGVMVCLQCEDEAARTSDACAQLGKDIAMQVAAARPVATRREDVPQQLVDKEKEIYLTQIKNSGKPEKIWDKIVDGKMNKFYSQIVLQEQEYIKNPDISISERVKEASRECGADISIAWFERLEIGYQE
jgi:elongation factor Ts